MPSDCAAPLRGTGVGHERSWDQKFLVPRPPNPTFQVNAWLLLNLFRPTDQATPCLEPGLRILDSVLLHLPRVFRSHVSSMSLLYTTFMKCRPRSCNLLGLPASSRGGFAIVLAMLLKICLTKHMGYPLSWSLWAKNSKCRALVFTHCVLRQILRTSPFTSPLLQLR